MGLQWDHISRFGDLCTSSRAPSIQYIDSIVVANIPALQLAGHQVPPPSKHPAAVRQCQSLHRKAKKRSLFHTTGTMEWVKNTEDRKPRRRIPEFQQDEEKRKQENEVRTGLTLKRYTWPRAGHQFVGVDYPYCPQATLPHLLPTKLYSHPYYCRATPLRSEAVSWGAPLLPTSQLGWWIVR